MGEKYIRCLYTVVIKKVTWILFCYIEKHDNDF